MARSAVDHPGPGFGDTPPGRRSARRGGREREDPAARRERRAEKHREAVAADPEDRARELCLASLANQARTRSQLEALLSRREIPPESAQRVLDRLTEVGLVDDEQFAQQFVVGRAAAGQARRSLRHGLARAGVGDDVAQHAVAAVDDDAERAAAEQLVARRMRSLAGLPEQVRTRRLVGMLARKGYDAALCYDVVRRAGDIGGGEAERELIEP